MPAKKTKANDTPVTLTKEQKLVADFGKRPGTHYHKMVTALVENMNKPIGVADLARAAYGSGALKKHQRRVQTMANRVQENDITKKRMPLKIVKEKTDDGTTTICLADK